MLLYGVYMLGQPDLVLVVLFRLKEGLPVLLTSACQMTRYLYDMALDAFDRYNYNIFTIVKWTYDYSHQKMFGGNEYSVNCTFICPRICLSIAKCFALTLLTCHCCGV